MPNDANKTCLHPPKKIKNNIKKRTVYIKYRYLAFVLNKMVNSLIYLLLCHVLMEAYD